MSEHLNKNIEFLSWAESSSETHERIIVKQADLDIINAWNRFVQPEINREKDRADNGWNWLWIYSSNWLIGTVLRQKPIFYTVGIVLNNSFFPLGLLFMVNKFTYPKSKDLKCSFVWYLSAAPDSVYQKLQQDYEIKYEKLKIGKVLMDIAICCSVHAGNKGRVLLHADPKGKDKLIGFYKNYIKMHILENHFPISGIRENDGRYFYFDESRANEFSNELRKPQLALMQQLTKIFEQGALSSEKIKSSHVSMEGEKSE